MEKGRERMKRGGDLPFISRGCYALSNQSNKREAGSFFCCKVPTGLGECVYRVNHNPIRPYLRRDSTQGKGFSASKLAAHLLQIGGAAGLAGSRTRRYVGPGVPRDKAGRGSRRTNAREDYAMGMSRRSENTDIRG